VVIEGIDGAGTTTQARLLASALERAGHPVLLTYEPTDSPVGKLIRDCLSGKLRTPEGPYHPDERTLCLLFAADRMDHSRLIESSLAQGRWVVCDRYVLSSLAYQSLDPRLETRWVVKVNEGCAKPDLTILLEVPPEDCLSRLAARRGTPTQYETAPKLERIHRNYLKVLPLYRRRFGEVERVDGTPPAAQVHRAIWDVLRRRWRGLGRAR